jgi:hypothetical protein
MTWQSERGHPTFEPFFAGYSDDGIAKLTCSAGHKTFHLIQSTKFENLMESGADANQVMINASLLIFRRCVTPSEIWTYLRAGELLQPSWRLFLRSLVNLFVDVLG